MSLLKMLGIGGGAEPDARGETETVRRIAGKLERLPRDQARFLASFAYVLARVANADLKVEDSEVAEMERIVREVAQLSEAEAVLVVEIARSQATLLGGTENYVVTREFRQLADRDQRQRLLECIYAVAAADGTISSVETREIRLIAEELGFTRAEANALREVYHDKLSEFQT